MKSAVLLSIAAGLGFAADPLQFEKAIPLARVEGRIDHMSADVRGARLFVSALGNKTLEVLDWNAGTTLQSIGRLDEPQGALYVPANNRFYVATGGDGSLRIFDGATYKLLQTVKLGNDADNIRFDTASQLVWVGYGDGSVAGFKADDARVADIRLGHHPESFQMENGGSRMFVNLPGSKDVAVVDRATKSVVARWSTGFTFSNFPMALDENSKRLFVVCRVPARVLVFDTDSGRIVTRFDTVGDSDDAFYDTTRHLLYVIGGEGAINVYRQSGPDHYTPVTRIATAPGARTGLFVPDANRLFVAVPHRGAQRAEIRVYKLQ